MAGRVFRYAGHPQFFPRPWYNLVACSGISFFTVAAGFYEMLGIRSSRPDRHRQCSGMPSVASRLVIVAMTIWRGYQRFVWRKDLGRQVSWLYLLCGIGMLLVMGLHGSLGAWLASDFGVHITADQLLAAGADLQELP